MTTEPSTTTSDAAGAPLDPGRRRRILEGFIGQPASEGNRVERLRNGDEIFPAMLAAVDAAERSIDFMTYVYWTGDITHRFAEALCRAAERGVRVRVLLDSFGSRQMDTALVDRMRHSGATVAYFRPYSSWKVWTFNLRTHRRVLVCDERVGFTGGAGIAEEWAGDARGPHEWRDTHFRLEGPAVDGLRAAFLSDWLETPHLVIDERDEFPPHGSPGDVPVQTVRASSQPGWNDVTLALRGAIAVARRRLRITSAYFRPNDHFVDLLCRTVGRGVDVEVLVPGPHAEPKIARWASEAVYRRLLEAGVVIWRYQPAMHHAKIVTVDGGLSVVGTANFDARSMALNEQVAVVVHDAGFTGQLDADFDDDVAQSRRVHPDEWAERSVARRVTEHAVDALTYGLRGAGASRR